MSLVPAPPKQGKSDTAPEVQARQNLAQVRLRFEQLIQKQDQKMSEHLQRAQAARDDRRKHLSQSRHRWKARSALNAKNAAARAAAKLVALESKDEENDLFINTARSLADDYHSQKGARLTQRQLSWSEKKRARDEEGAAVVEDLCLKHAFFLPEKPKNLSQSARTCSAPAVEHLLTPLKKSSASLPSLIKSRDEANRQHLEDLRRQREERIQRQQEAKSEHQKEVTERVQTLLEASVKRVMQDLKKKEEACERVARLMDTKRNPRRAKALERLAEEDPELYQV